MKLEELSFKVITGTEERNRAIQDALFAKGGKWAYGKAEIKWLDSMALSYSHHEQLKLWTEPFISDSTSFPRKDLPEVTFQQALDLIAQVEEPQPEFPFKPFDKVLISIVDKLGFCASWAADFYSHVSRDEQTFICVGEAIPAIVKFEGNESLIGTQDTPPEWWEVENGKPVLKRRDD